MRERDEKKGSIIIGRAINNYFRKVVDGSFRCWYGVHGSDRKLQRCLVAVRGLFLGAICYLAAPNLIQCGVSFGC